MLKYKDKYRVKYEKDLRDGKNHNKDDNYIECKKGGQIYRYNDEILIFYAPYKPSIKDYIDYILSYDYSDEEIIVEFKEKDFKKLTKLCKPKRKKQYTEEQKQIMVARLAEARNKNS